MWWLVCDLRRLEARGRIDLFGFMPEVPRRSDRHLYLDILTARLAAGSRGMLLLVGNFHARKAAGSLASQLAQAGIPVSAVTVSSPAATAWNCQQDGCGPQPFPMRFCKSQSSAPRLLLGEKAGFGPSPQWDGCLFFPVLTASPPAVRGARPGG